MMQIVRSTEGHTSVFQGLPAGPTASDRHRALRRPIWLPAISISALLLCAIAGVVAQNSSPAQLSERDRASEASPNSPADAAKTLTTTGGRIEGYLASGRWREGSKLVDVPGQFKISGDRVAFYSQDGKSRFACLENLNSERVYRIVGESPVSLEWTVQGTITEFRSENFLLVTQAVIRGRGNRVGRSPNDSPKTP
jgi:hypothetical protein